MNTQSSILLVLGLILTTWGWYRIKKDKKLIGSSKKLSTILDFILTGQASGLGQLLSGILCLILFIVFIFLK